MQQLTSIDLQQLDALGFHTTVNMTDFYGATSDPANPEALGGSQITVPIAATP
ncbi:hypothetical protein [Bradyrhizobium jicamae]|uniref:hypothetical protein n=1 Tax=Bradyrhizobium jicamae TaxID=280332 RepID=UPI0020116D9A|nr:hypothetical protein [Bradyrhizobium jicamae]